jgi:hypothetical protein
VRDAFQAGLVRQKQLLAAEGSDVLKARLRAAIDVTIQGTGMRRTEA